MNRFETWSTIADRGVASVVVRQGRHTVAALVKLGDERDSNLKRVEQAFMHVRTELHRNQSWRREDVEDRWKEIRGSK